MSADVQANKRLLATCYIRADKPHRAYELLQGTTARAVTTQSAPDLHSLQPATRPGAGQHPRASTALCGSSVTMPGAGTERRRLVRCRARAAGRCQPVSAGAGLHAPGEGPRGGERSQSGQHGLQSACDLTLKPVGCQLQGSAPLQPACMTYASMYRQAIACAGEERNLWLMMPWSA